MRVLERWQTLRGERQRNAALQAGCDHDWKVVRGDIGQHLFRNIEYECRKCGKVGFTPVGQGPPR